MINKSYRARQDLTTSSDGTTANFTFGLSAVDVPIADARNVEIEFGRFLGRVTGRSVPAAVSPTRTLTWSDEEKVSIQDAETTSEARRMYRAAYPESKRSDSAIKNMHLELKERSAAGPVTRNTAPVDPEVERTPPGTGKKSMTRSDAQQARGNKYGIPSDLAKTDLKLYQRLWYRCSKKGIMYEEALKMEGPVTTGRGHKKTSVKKPKLPYRLKNQQKPADPADTPGPTASDVIKKTANPPHAEIPPSSGSPIVTGPPSEGLKIGDEVRQTGGTRICSGTGRIIRAVPGSTEALVRFDHGQEWIRKEHLTKVAA